MSKQHYSLGILKRLRRFVNDVHEMEMYIFRIEVDVVVVVYLRIYLFIKFSTARKKGIYQLLYQH